MRKDGHELLRKLRTCLRAPLAPGPGGGRDIRKDRDAELLRARREPPVKIRIIDEDEQIRTLLAHEIRQPLQKTADASEVFQHFPDAHDVIAREIRRERHARLRHLPAAEAHELHLRRLREDGLCQPGPVEVAGDLPCGKHDFHARFPSSSCQYILLYYIARPIQMKNIAACLRQPRGRRIFSPRRTVPGSVPGLVTAVFRAPIHKKTAALRTACSNPCLYLLSLSPSKRW